MIDFLLNHNLVPDFLIRQKIRKLNEERLSVERGKYSTEYVEKFIQDLSASFQKNISDLLIEKLERGLERLKLYKVNVKSLSVVGGVSNNKYIRKKLEYFFYNKNIEIYYPVKEMMIDNAAMIAWACMKFYNKDRNDLFFKPMPRLGVRSVL